MLATAYGEIDRSHRRPNANGFSYPIDRALFVSPVTNGVAGCQHSGNQTPTFQHTPTAIGSSWTMSLSGAPANSPIALFLVGGQGLTAPFSLASIGLQASCQGQLPLTGLSAFSGTSNSGGSASWSVAVPNDLALNNYLISAQVAAIDFFSPGSLVVSNASQVRFGVNPPAAIVYSSGNANAVTGSIYANQGVVTFFN